MLLSFSPEPAKIQARQDLPAQCAPESGLDSGPLKSIDRAVFLADPARVLAFDYFDDYQKIE